MSRGDSLICRELALKHLQEEVKQIRAEPTVPDISGVGDPRYPVEQGGTPTQSSAVMSRWGLERLAWTLGSAGGARVSPGISVVDSRVDVGVTWTRCLDSRRALKDPVEAEANMARESRRQSAMSSPSDDSGNRNCVGPPDMMTSEHSIHEEGVGE